jgi:hypothetical protein
MSKITLRPSSQDLSYQMYICKQLQSIRKEGGPPGGGLLILCGVRKELSMRPESDNCPWCCLFYAFSQQKSVLQKGLFLFLPAPGRCGFPTEKRHHYFNFWLFFVAEPPASPLTFIVKTTLAAIFCCRFICTTALSHSFPINKHISGCHPVQGSLRVPFVFFI